MEQTNSSVETTIEQSRVAEETPNQETPKKVEEVVPTEKTVTPDERNCVEPAFSNEKEFDPNKEDDPSGYFPSNDYQTVYEMFDQLSKLSAEVLKATNTVKGAISKHVITNGGKNSLIEKVYLNEVNDTKDSEFLNKLAYGEKNLVPGPIKIKAKTGVISGQSALAAFNTSLGIGEIVEIPLWHSGFWVALRPPKQAEVVNLQANIANAAVTLGRDTNSVIYSNYSVVSVRIIMEFIKEHILHTTLDVPVDDIFKHVCVQDIQPLVLGLIISMYPKGAPVTRSCIQSTELNDEGLPKCDYSVTGQVDPKKLLFVNRKALTKEHMQIMSKKLPNSVKEDEAAEYRKTIAKLNDRIIEFNTNDRIIRFTLSLPNADEYITAGEEWINNIINKAESMFTEADSADSKDRRVTEMLYTNILGIFSTFVTKITLDDDVEVVDKQTIIGLLETLSTDEAILKNYIKSVTKYISESAVAIVATPSYVCPSCKTDQSVNELPEFHSLIPLNVIETFFDLCALRALRVRLATM